MKGHLKHLKIWSPLDPCVTPTGKWPNRLKFCQKYFLTYNDFKTINNSFSSKWHLGTSSTTGSILKNIARCNFLLITVMFIKISISRMKMSQRIRFWYKTLLKMLFLFWKTKMQKITLLVKSNCDNVRKINLKYAKIAWKSCWHTTLGRVFFFVLFFVLFCFFFFFFKFLI